MFACLAFVVPQALAVTVPKYAVTISVVDGSGVPVPNALVGVQLAPRRAIACVTDVNGVCVFNLASGTYNCLVNKKGYSPVVGTISVNNSPASFSFVLVKLP
jgi:uncharacterized membrane protein